MSCTLKIGTKCSTWCWSMRIHFTSQIFLICFQYTFEYVLRSIPFQIISIYGDPVSFDYTICQSVQI